MKLDLSHRVSRLIESQFLELKAGLGKAAESSESLRAAGFDMTKELMAVHGEAKITYRITLEVSSDFPFNEDSDMDASDYVERYFPRLFSVLRGIAGRTISFDMDMRSYIWIEFSEGVIS